MDPTTFTVLLRPWPPLHPAKEKMPETSSKKTKDFFPRNMQNLVTRFSSTQVVLKVFILLHFYGGIQKNMAGKRQGLTKSVFTTSAIHQTEQEQKTMRSAMISRHYDIRWTEAFFYVKIQISFIL
ncbi:MAG TPA: hypothetical protein PLC40_11325 [Candidatus Hydrogenedentes bacterium]|nr:hypothetical protein [Candidatus Hydrogenedentota bacterium]